MPTKILAIDDSKTMRLAIKITFAAEDAKVTAVSKGSEAVARAKQMQAEVVLVDHSLAPGEPTGFQVVEALKSNPATSHIPVILLIPAKGSITEADVQAAGADGYIGKPFDSQELIDKVGAAIGRGASKPAAKPAVRPAAKPAVAPAAARVPAPRPKPAPTAARPAPAPAPKPVAKPAPPPTSRPAAAPVRPAAAPVRPAAAPVRPAAAPARPAAAPARPAARPAVGAPVGASTASAIPIAIPIPFTAAGSPTSGMLDRIRAAAGNSEAAAGLDPAAVQALLQLSQEVVEQVVWEVVPELAEELIKQRAQG